MRNIHKIETIQRFFDDLLNRKYEQKKDKQKNSNKLNTKLTKYI